MKPIRILIGPAALEVRESCLLVFPRATDPRHLTIHYAPNPSGRNTGFFTPHVTLPATRERRTLAVLGNDGLQRFAQAYERELMTRFCASVRRVELGDLDREGWVTAVIPSDRLTQFAAEHLKEATGAFRLTEEAALRFWDLVVEHLADVRELEELPAGERRGQIMRVTDDGEFEAAHVGYLPAGPGGDPKGAGWYLLRRDWLGEGELDAIFARCLGPRFFRAVRRLGRLLRIPIDHENVSRIEALGRRIAPVPPELGGALPGTATD